MILVVLLLAHWLYSAECCGGRDCHPVPCAEVHAIDAGWQWHGIMFASNVLKVSPDGACHVCHGSKAFIGHCIYLPPDA